MRILGMESSCDETAAAVVDSGVTPFAGSVKILANVVLSQIAIHAEYGGVVPELASRAHIANIGLVVQQALDGAAIFVQDLDGIAVTTGPGLIGGLLVGLAVAKGLALASGKPLVGVHHMEGHLLSPFLSGERGMDFPFVVLLVSGGHTILLYARGLGDYRFLGQTRDDAVGEAFDKGARLLGLGYPGGPAVAQLAVDGDPNAVNFPRILLDKTRFDFSFSGLKTSLRNYLQSAGATEGAIKNIKDIAASYQEALVQTLAIKAISACHHMRCPRLLVAGGVGANRRLREVLGERAGQSIQVFFPPLDLCVDNGAMIALAGWRLLTQEPNQHGDLDARARWPVQEICSGV